MSVSEEEEAKQWNLLKDIGSAIVGEPPFFFFKIYEHRSSANHFYRDGTKVEASRRSRHFVKVAHVDLIAFKLF